MDTNEPKKYIRTLAGDMDSLKKGQVPNLAPLPEPQASSPAERLVAASPLPLEKKIEQPLPESAVDTSKLFVPVSVPKTEPPLSPIQTYGGDFQDRVRDTHATPASILAAEQDAAVSQPEVAQKKSHKVGAIIGGIILLSVGGFGLYAAYTVKTTLPVDILAPTLSTPIFVEDQQQVAGTGAELLTVLQQSIDRQLPSGTIRQLSIGDGISTTSVFTALQLPAPNIILRNLNSAGSMAGVIRTSTNQSAFFILSVASYGETFSGMLSWEHTMPHNLAGLFPSYPMQVTSSATSSQATTTPREPVFAAGFRDEVINSHDVRVYRDAEMRSIIVYGYWDQKTLIIARDPVAFAELITRLASTRKQ
jgi:hypothetical protein